MSSISDGLPIPSIEAMRKLDAGESIVFKRRNSQDDRTIQTNKLRLKCEYTMKVMVLLDPESLEAQKVILVQRIF